MSGTDTNLAAAALAIALVALITAVAQLLQQYFATADGYRRCHGSVMGEYARKTRLHRRWREFRFETLYTTPEIFLTGDGAPSRISQVILTGSDSSRLRSLVPTVSMSHEELVMDGEDFQAASTQKASNHRWNSTDKHPGSSRSYGGEMTSWVPLLYWLHETTQLSLQNEREVPDPVTFAPPQFRLIARFPPSRLVSGKLGEV